MALQADAPLWRQAGECSALAAGGVFALAAARPPILAALAGLFAVCAAVIVAAVAGTQSRPVGWALAAWACELLGWFTFAALTSPWSTAAITALAVPAVPLCAASALAVAHHRSLVSDKTRLAALARAQAALASWTDTITRAGCPGAIARTITATRYGTEVRLTLTAPARFSALNRPEICEAIETAKHLRRGAVRFDTGKHSGDAWLRITSRDVLSEEVPFPDDLTPLSITRPFAVGLLENGEPAEILMREVRQLIVGLTGSGKSNLLHVEIAQLGRMTDAVIFMIDMKGGRVARQWILPWVADPGKIRRPVIDWIACDRAEVEIMLRTILAMIDARSRGIGGEKIKPGRHQPAIILIVDELAVVFGDGGPSKADAAGATNRALAAMGTQIATTGRSEAVDPIWATQRGTVSMTGGGDLKSQCKLRVGLAVNDRADAAQVIPDDIAAQRILANIHHSGAGVISRGGRDAAPAPVKFYRLDPDDPADRITGIARMCGPWRPALDELSAAAGGRAYSERWERAAPIIRQWRGDQPAPAPGPARQTEPARGGTATIPPVAESAAEIAELFREGAPASDLAHDARRVRMLELLAGRGPAGYMPGMIKAMLDREGLGVARETVQRWLADEEHAGTVRRAGGGRWVIREDGQP